MSRDWLGQLKFIAQRLRSLEPEPAPAEPKRGKGAGG